MSLATAVLEIAEEMAGNGGVDALSKQLLNNYASQLRRVVKAAESVVAAVNSGSHAEMLEQARHAERLRRRAAEEEADTAHSLRLCVGGSLDNTCVPAGSAELGKPVKAPTGEYYVLKADGRFHLYEQGKES